MISILSPYRRFYLLQAITVIFFSLSVTHMTAQSDIWQVTRVVDGDTFYASREGESAKFRLIGIDTPEFSDFGKPEEPFIIYHSSFITHH